VYERHELEAKDGCSWKLRPVRRPIEREIATLGCRGSTPSTGGPMHRPAPHLEPISDSVDPPREMPLVGPVQLHHAHYRCTVHFAEVTRVGWPVPYTTTKEDAQEVLYIDHDHLHMVGNVDPGPGAGY